MYMKPPWPRCPSRQQTEIPHRRPGSNYWSTNSGGGCTSPAWTPKPSRGPAQIRTVVSGDVLRRSRLIEKTARLIHKFFALIPVFVPSKNRTRAVVSLGGIRPTPPPNRRRAGSVLPPSPGRRWVPPTPPQRAIRGVAGSTRRITVLPAVGFGARGRGSEKTSSLRWPRPQGCSARPPRVRDRLPSQWPC